MSNTESPPKDEPPKKQTTSRYAPRGQGAEAKRVNARLTGFKMKQSTAYKYLCRKFSPNVTHTELKSIATILCLRTGLKLDRDATRDNRVLIKWFDENWPIVKKNLEFIKLLDDDQNIINESRKEKL